MPSSTHKFCGAIAAIVHHSCRSRSVFFLNLWRLFHPLAMLPAWPPHPVLMTGLVIQWMVHMDGSIQKSTTQRSSYEGYH